MDVVAGDMAGDMPSTPPRVSFPGDPHTMCGTGLASQQRVLFSSSTSVAQLLRTAEESCGHGQGTQPPA